MPETQTQLIREFFHEHPHQDVPTNQVVDWAIKSFYARSSSEAVDSTQELSVENAATLCGKHKNIFIATKSQSVACT